MNTSSFVQNMHRTFAILNNIITTIQDFDASYMYIHLAVTHIFSKQFDFQYLVSCTCFSITVYLELHESLKNYRVYCDCSKANATEYPWKILCHCEECFLKNRKYNLKKKKQTIPCFHALLHLAKHVQLGILKRLMCVHRNGATNHILSLRHVERKVS